MEPYGLEMTKLLVENISLPQAVEEALDKRSSMGVVGNLNAYTQFQAANAMEDVANNPSQAGMAGGGMGMGMGFAMANQMGQAMSPGAANQAGNASPAAAPPPLPGQASFYVALDGKQAGPFDSASLARLASEGKVNRDSLVWKQGMANWTPAGQVAELGNLFGATPPPLPGQS
jgi:hypothetical protein